MEYELRGEDRYLHAKLSGPCTMEDMVAISKILNNELKRTGRNKILIDKSEITVDFDVIGAYQLVVYNLPKLANGELNRVALIDRKITNMGKFISSLAYKKGHFIRSFLYQTEAKKWLNN